MVGEKTLAELAQQYEVHLNQISSWKRQLSEYIAVVFDKDVTAVPSADLKSLHAKIRQLSLEKDFLELHLEHPFMGAHMLRDQLNRSGLD